LAQIDFTVFSRTSGSLPDQVRREIAAAGPLSAAIGPGFRHAAPQEYRRGLAAAPPRRAWRVRFTAERVSLDDDSTSSRRCRPALAVTAGFRPDLRSAMPPSCDPVRAACYPVELWTSAWVHRARATCACAREGAPRARGSSSACRLGRLPRAGHENRLVRPGPGRHRDRDGGEGTGAERPELDCVPSGIVTHTPVSSATTLSRSPWRRHISPRPPSTYQISSTVRCVTARETRPGPSSKCATLPPASWSRTRTSAPSGALVSARAGSRVVSKAGTAVISRPRWPGTRRRAG
jgi:hypothetical protein